MPGKKRLINGQKFKTFPIKTISSVKKNIQADADAMFKLRRSFLQITFDNKPITTEKKADLRNHTQRIIQHAIK